MTETLLVELLTEELPPKALQKLSQAFCHALVEDLRQDNLLTHDSAAEAYATPRRLAVSISHVLDKAPDQPIEVATVLRPIDPARFSFEFGGISRF